MATIMDNIEVVYDPNPNGMVNPATVREEGQKGSNISTHRTDCRELPYLSYVFYHVIVCKSGK